MNKFETGMIAIGATAGAFLAGHWVYNKLETLTFRTMAAIDGIESIDAHVVQHLQTWIKAGENENRRAVETLEVSEAVLTMLMEELGIESTETSLAKYSCDVEGDTVTRVRKEAKGNLVGGATVESHGGHEERELSEDDEAMLSKFREALGLDEDEEAVEGSETPQNNEGDTNTHDKDSEGFEGA